MTSPASAAARMFWGMDDILKATPGARSVVLSRRFSILKVWEKLLEEYAFAVRQDTVNEATPNGDQ